VLVETEGGVTRVWTVIEAEPFAFSSRRPVYDAELQAMVAHPGIEADFRLVSASEYRHVPLAPALPPDDATLYARSRDARQDFGLHVTGTRPVARCPLGHLLHCGWRRGVMAIRAARPTERAKREFLADLVERLKRLPQVRRVLVETEGGVTRVWTVIEAEPFENSARDPVFDAELQAMIAHPDVEAGFRLLNSREYAGKPLAAYLPPDAALLYER
jgi:hypothetical protein